MGCASPSCRCCWFTRYSAVPRDVEIESGLSPPLPSAVYGASVSDGDNEDNLLSVAPRRVLCRQQSLVPKATRRAGGHSPESVLAEGAAMHSFCFGPWVERDEGFVARAWFEDPDGRLELTEPQRGALQKWCRFPQTLLATGAQNSAVVFADLPTSDIIRQGFVPDCSLISALSVLAEYESRFSRPVLSGIIHPRQEVGGKQMAAFNRCGWYQCRLFINGTSRSVVVDDYVPVDHNMHLLCAHSSRKCELWVTLLEKAIAKIMGGSYAIYGSNPGVDIFHLTGWVPENVPLRAGISSPCGIPVHLAETVSEHVSNGLPELFYTALDGYVRGHCVVCVGTTELMDAVQHEEAQLHGYTEGVSVSTGLVANHAYPVLDCRYVNGLRLLLLKNPWGRIRWRGRFSPGDAAWSDHPCVAAALACKCLSTDEDDGRFWIEWDDVTRYFSNFYLCWSPQALGLHCLQVHDRFDLMPHVKDSLLENDTDLLAFNPQFLLHLSALPPDNDGDVGIWVLLSRHVRKRGEPHRHFINVSVYSTGSRICCPDEPLKQGVFSDGECALTKLSGAMVQGSNDFVLVVSQHMSNSAFNFTMQVYITVPGTLTPLPPLVPNDFASGSVRGEWTPRTAGGCGNDVWSFFQNPQWRIEVPQGGLAVLILLVECPAADSVNVRLFSGAVAQPDALKSAISSGAYTRGCCLLRLIDVPPGPCIAVVSNFRPGLCAEYQLVWHATHAIELRPQPHPFAGALAHPLKSTVRIVRPGQHTRFKLRFIGDELGKMKISARLQTDIMEGPLPLLELFRSQVALEPVHCELLDQADAERYFCRSGAIVILLAELTLGESYTLEVLAPGGTERDAKVLINSDRPVALDNTSVV